MNRSIIAAGVALAALAVVGCGGKATAKPSAAASYNPNAPNPAYSQYPHDEQGGGSVAASYGSDTSWRGVGTQGRSGTSCDLLPWQAFASVLPGSAIDSSWDGGYGAAAAIAVDHGVMYVQATDALGNSECQIAWHDPNGNSYQLAFDFEEHTNQADSWSGNPPGANCDNCTAAPVDNYSGGPAGMQYATWGVCSGVPNCVDVLGNPIKDDGSRSFEVLVPDGTTDLEFLGGINATEGMDMQHLAKLAQIAIDRTPAYTPTNTLYGVNQLP